MRLSNPLCSVRPARWGRPVTLPRQGQPPPDTGSANFSEASTRTNDKNMMMIQGSTRVAEIYIGEFLRLHSHYAFRPCRSGRL